MVHSNKKNSNCLGLLVEAALKENLTFLAFYRTCKKYVILSSLRILLSSNIQFVSNSTRHSMTVLEATWLIIPRLLFLRNFGFFTVFLINFGPIGRRREWLSSSSITPKSLLQCQVLDSSPGSFLIKIIYQEVYELCMKTHHRKGGRCVHTKGVILIFRSK